MMVLLGTAVRWIARHAFVFLLVVVALVALAKALEAYRAVPAMRAEVTALERQERLLEERVCEERASAQAGARRLGELELQELHRRLAQVRAEISVAVLDRRSRGGLALDAIRGDTSAIADRLGRAFELQLLRKEEAAIGARLRMIARGNRLESVADFIRRADGRAQAIERRITDIERRHPLLSKGGGRANPA